MSDMFQSGLKAAAGAFHRKSTYRSEGLKSRIQTLPNYSEEYGRLMVHVSMPCPIKEDFKYTLLERLQAENVTIPSAWKGPSEIPVKLEVRPEEGKEEATYLEQYQ